MLLLDERDSRVDRDRDGPAGFWMMREAPVGGRLMPGDDHPGAMGGVSSGFSA